MRILEDESARPHLLRAIYDWCLEKKQTPYLAAQALRDDVRLPPAANPADKVIVLNIGPEAVRDLRIERMVSFVARFRGAPFEVMLPAGAVIGLYARETGAGLSFFPVPAQSSVADSASADASPQKPSPDKPSLQVI